MNLGKSLPKLVLGVFILLSQRAQSLTNSAAELQNDFSAQVFIANDGFDNDGSVVTGFCNGTLLSHSVMVTAAHCVKEAFLMKSRFTRVQVGKYIFKKRADGVEQKIGYLPYFDQQISGHYFFSNNLSQKISAQGKSAEIGPAEDLALVIFDQPLTAAMDSSDKNFQDLQNLKFNAVISAAELRGITGREINYWPTIVSTNPLTEISTSDSKRSARLTSLNFDSDGYFESQSNSRVEEGDSGAPLFLRIGTAWRIAAVTKGKAENFFSDWDVFAALDSKICEAAKASTNPEAIALVCR